MQLELKPWCLFLVNLLYAAACARAITWYSCFGRVSCSEMLAFYNILSRFGRFGCFGGFGGLGILGGLGRLRIGDCRKTKRPK